MRRRHLATLTEYDTVSMVNLECIVDEFEFKGHTVPDSVADCVLVVFGLVHMLGDAWEIATSVNSTAPEDRISEIRRSTKFER